MPESVVLALIGAAGIGIGYVLKPIGDLLAQSRAERHETAESVRRFRRKTLLAIQDVLADLIGTTMELTEDPLLENPARRLRLEFEKLSVRVDDDRLRQRLAEVTAATRAVRTTTFDSEQLRKAYDAANQRLGEVLRAL